MSFAADQVRLLDAQLDGISAGFGRPDQSDDVDSTDPEGLNAALEAMSTPRIDELLPVLKALSVGSSRPQLSRDRIRRLLRQTGLTGGALHIESATAGPQDPRTHEDLAIEWLTVGKAAAQAHGLVLQTLLKQLVPLSDEIYYWEEVQGSYRYSSLHAVQTAPLRLWDLYQQNKPRFDRLDSSTPVQVAESTWTGLTQPWLRFYGIVRDSIRDRSFATVQGKLLSPMAFSRRQAGQKIVELKKMRAVISTGIGILVGRGLILDENAVDNNDWKFSISKGIATIEAALMAMKNLDTGNEEDYEDMVLTALEEDSLIRVFNDDSQTFAPGLAASRLLACLENVMPQEEQIIKELTQEHGRPSFVVRYWLPALVAALSSTTVLRILVNRKAALLQWTQDLGATIRDFWVNWVVTPVTKVVRTIRHDETSEIALMSRDSLKADRESLERMVVDFAVDNPHFAGIDSNLTERDIDAIRAKVSEGDVTPVLKAYEQDLRKPFMGTVKGDLVRSLLIQVQKTKVDLEVAISGIDALLRSQELVFGFVGLTPGILVSFSVLQYLRGVLGGRRGVKDKQKAGKGVRILRNIDRILSEGKPGDGEQYLNHMDIGLLVCEVHLLRNLMHRLMPREVEKEFLEDLRDLEKPRKYEIQVGALERIKWTYSVWMK